VKKTYITFLVLVTLVLLNLSYGAIDTLGAFALAMLISPVYIFIAILGTVFCFIEVSNKYNSNQTQLTLPLNNNNGIFILIISIFFTLSVIITAVLIMNTQLSFK
jgi:hypothetical protein